MKLLLTNLQPIFNTKNNTIKQCSQIQPRYNYNLNCDVISFTSKKDDSNSANIYKDISENKYKQAYHELEDLSPYYHNKWSWNPNYVSNNTKKTSLMSLVIKKIAREKEYNDDLIKIANLIANHNNFKLINPTTKEDYIKSAINTLKDEKLANFLDTDIIYADGVEENILDYIKLAQRNNKPESEALLQQVFEKISDDDDSKKMSITEYQNIKESLHKEKELKTNIEKELNPYKLLLKSNDPKSLDEVGGMFDAKSEIKEFIVKPWDIRYRQRIIDNNLERPSGFLLSGPPGCGKTYIMKAIAAETKYPLYEVNLANIGTSAAYKTQSDIKKLFDNFEELYKITKEPSILILDELDSIAMNRKNVKTDWKIDDINSILMALNNSAQKGIIVVGATNNPDNLDEAVRRPGRLDRQIAIGIPTNEERKDIIAKILSDKEIAKELTEHIPEMADKMDKMSPAQISAILNETCLHAIYGCKDYADLEDFNFAVDKIKSNKKITEKQRNKIGF